MKALKVFLTLSAITLFTGCLTPSEKQWTCDNAAAAYEAYKAAVAAGHQPSQDEIIAVAGAAQFLRFYCGWTTPQRGLYTVDANFIPNLVK